MKSVFRPLTPYIFVLALLFSWAESVSAFEVGLQVSTPQNTPEAAVAAAIADFCPKLQNDSGGGEVSLGTETDELLRVCTALTEPTVDEATTEEAYRDLSARSATAILTMMSRGPSSQPIELIDKRLAVLRKAAATLSTAKLDLDMNGKHLPTDFLAESFSASGGAASGDELGSRLSGFASGLYVKSEQDETNTLAGYDGDTMGLVFGIDYRFMDTLFAGVALRYGQSDVTLDRNAGSLESNDFNLTLYTTKYLSTSLYIDATAHYGSSKFDLKRELSFQVPVPPPNQNLSVNIEDTASGDTNGSQLGASFGAGYEWLFARSWVTQLIGNLRYNNMSIDSYEEANALGLNLRIEEQSIESFKSKLGVSMSHAFGLSWGVIAPQLDLFWFHEFITGGDQVKATFLADPYGTQFVFTTDEIDSDYFTASLGVVFILPGGASSYLNYEAYIDYEGYDQSAVTLGGRWEF